MKFYSSWPERNIIQPALNDAGLPNIRVYLFDFLVKKGSDIYAIEVKAISKRKNKKTKWFTIITCNNHQRQIQTAELMGFRRAFIFVLFSHSLEELKKSNFEELNETPKILVLDDTNELDKLICSSNVKVKGIWIKKFIDQAIPLNQWIKNKKNPTLDEHIL